MPSVVEDDGVQVGVGLLVQVKQTIHLRDPMMTDAITKPAQQTLHVVGPCA